MSAPRALVASLLVLAPLRASAQQLVSHDTLGSEAPTAVTCGFCATERFGVVFRELPPPRRGIEPEDFPITLESVQVALASATVSPGPTCTPSEAGGTIVAPVEVYAGTEIPTGAITSLPSEGPWPGEVLVWAADAPLELSPAQAGGGRYELSFNELVVRDEDEQPIVVETGSYLRVVVTLPAAEPATPCQGGLDSPAGFPFRDSDGRIAPERSFIYAAGVGWLWNEQASIDGDWGLRLRLFRAAPRDGGAADLDAGSPGDAGSPRDAGSTRRDASGGADSGLVPGGGGCSCRASSARRAPWPLGLGALALLALRRRRRASAAQSEITV